MKCKLCGKIFEYGNRLDGLPNGFGFVLETGENITICVDCLIQKGKEMVKN